MGATHRQARETCWNMAQSDFYYYLTFSVRIVALSTIIISCNSGSLDANTSPDHSQSKLAASHWSDCFLIGSFQHSEDSWLAFNSLKIIRATNRHSTLLTLDILLNFCLNLNWATEYDRQPTHAIKKIQFFIPSICFEIILSAFIFFFFHLPPQLFL